MLFPPPVRYQVLCPGSWYSSTGGAGAGAGAGADPEAGAGAGAEAGAGV